MPFKPGHKKIGGRKKGTPNKATRTLMEICESQGVDPFEAMVEAAKLIHSPVDKVNAWEKVCAYLHPKRKATELTSKLDPKLEAELEQIMALSEEEQIRLAKEELKAKGVKQ